MTNATPEEPRLDRRRRRRRRDWAAAVARLLCAVLAVVGLIPFAATLVVRSAWARGWAVRETEHALRQEGIVATYDMALGAWPLSVDLAHVSVEASDGGPRAFVCNRMRMRPKLFAMLAGKLAIDQIDLDEPAVRLVLRDGAVTNLALTPHDKAAGPLHAPFGTFAATDASIDFDIDGTRVQAASTDLDVTAEDEPAAGSTFEIAMRVGRASLHRARKRDDGSIATDDDALCSIEGRVSLQPGGVLVRRFEGLGSADLDAAPATTPPCGLSSDDKRRVELSLGQLRITFPQGDRKWLEVDGHVGVRAPLALAERAASLLETDGWARFDADVRYGRGSILPDLHGTLEAHDVRLAKYAFAQELRSEISVQQNVVSSPKTTVRLANGTVVFSDSVVDPLAEGGGRLVKTRLDAIGVDFTALLRALGIHPHAHVGWDLRELHAPVVAGTFVPLKLDGDLTSKTYTFGVYDRPAEDHNRERIFGFSEAQIVSHFAVRADALRFTEVRATLPRSRIDGGLVSIGFHDDLRVDAPHIFADIDDLSPIGSVPLSGKLHASAHVGGTFDRPEIEGDVEAIGAFQVGDVAFGDVTGGHVQVHVKDPEVLVGGAHVRRRDSTYEVPTARLHFGGSRGFTVDAVGVSAGFGFRDLLSMFALDDDPRFSGLDATIATHTLVHVAVGGPEDACGGGYLGVDAKAHLRDVLVYGERFAQGEADASLHWYDRKQGIAGAEVDVRSFVLEKLRPTGGAAGAAVGTVLGSAALRRGGALLANVMVEGVPLAHVDALRAFSSDLGGSVSGVAHVTGDLDDFHPDAGFVARTELDVAGTRVRGVALPGSHLDVRMTHRLTPERRAVATTRCGAPVGPPFDKATYLADTSSHGEWDVDGNLLGNTAQVHDVVVTRAKAATVSGRVSLRGLDLGELAKIMSVRDVRGDDTNAAPASFPEGQLWGELIVDEIPVDRPSSSRARFFLGPTFVSLDGEKLTLQPPRDPLTLENDTLTTPPLRVTLDTPDGFRGGFVLSGAVSKATTDPTFALEARLEPVDLAVLQRVVPKVERASGKVQGSIRVTGKAMLPVVAGELHATADAVEVHGLPSAVTDLHLDARATATQLSFSGGGKFAGGSVVLDGTVPIRGLEMGTLVTHVVAHDVRLSPAEGVSATFDADLEATYGAGVRTEGKAMPRVTGDVVLSSFDYSRPVALTADLTQLGTRARRTEIDTYDPSLDFVAFDLRLRSRAPIVVKNNLVEAQLAIDSDALEVTGTNQRVGLRGALRTLPGGRFHFQQSDFEVHEGLIRFDDPTRVAANVDVTAVTEYRRYTDTGPSAAAGAGTGGDTTAASTGSTRGGSLWRITLHAYGDADNLRFDMTSEPTLSHEDIVLLLTVGMTRAELDQLQAPQAGSLGYSLALNYLGASSGADRAVKQALPIIDDFRFGSAYSTTTGKTEPQLTVGKRLTNELRASVTTGLSEDQELRSNIEWRLNNRLSVEGTYDNINDVSSSALGNLGVDLRWRLEFE